MSNARKRFHLLLISALLYGSLVVLLAYYGGHLIDLWGARPVVYVCILIFALSTTALVWFKFRRVAEAPRSWLFLKIIGSLVFIAAVAGSWLLDLSIDIAFLIMLAALVIWGLALGRLVRSVGHRDDR